MDEIINTVRDFILKEILPDENPDSLTDSTPMITGGILDSIATLNLISFLEEKYEITFEAHEIDADNMDTLQQIGKFVQSKRIDKNQL